MKVELRHNPNENFLGVKTTSDINRIIREGKFPELAMLSEAYIDKRIMEATFRIEVLRKRVILIAGPSSSGKTTFAKKLCIQLQVEGKKPLYLSTDDYFINRDDMPVDENGEKNFEDLDAVDVNLFNDNLNDLLDGKEVDIPTFNFITGKKEFGKRLTTISKDQPIIIEGIHALNDALTPKISRLHKFKIYICPIPAMTTDAALGIENEDLRMLRRISRDAMYRGRDADDTIRDWPKVRAGEIRNIIPYSKNVDMFFNSSHIYEIPILRHHVWDLLKAVDKKSPEYAVAYKMMDYLDDFEEYDNDYVVPSNSILREFIGGSLYAGEESPIYENIKARARINWLKVKK